MSGTELAAIASPAGLLRRLIVGWALIGGCVLLLLVVMTVISVGSGLLIGQPIAGDFELVEMGVAVAVFAFLPLCQLERANVTADIFTQKAGERAKAAMALSGSAIALLFAFLLLWRMSAGMLDYIAYDEYTAILGIPIWCAFPSILVSLALLSLAAIATMVDDFRRVRRQ